MSNKNNTDIKDNTQSVNKGKEHVIRQLKISKRIIRLIADFWINSEDDDTFRDAKGAFGILDDDEGEAVKIWEGWWNETIQGKVDKLENELPESLRMYFSDDAFSDISDILSKNKRNITNYKETVSNAINSVDVPATTILKVFGINFDIEGNTSKKITGIEQAEVGNGDKITSHSQSLSSLFAKKTNSTSIFTLKDDQADI